VEISTRIKVSDILRWALREKTCPKRKITGSMPVVPSDEVDEEWKITVGKSGGSKCRGRREKGVKSVDVVNQ
jgi:hypothetical protein